MQRTNRIIRDITEPWIEMREEHDRINSEVEAKLKALKQNESA